MDFAPDLPVILLLAACGVVSGLFAGLLGVGGGILLVPVLFWVLDSLGVSDWPMHIAVATSLANIVFTGSRSAWSHHKRGNVDWFVVKRYAPPMVIGTVFGVAIAAHINSLSLQIFFALMAMVLSVLLLIKPVVLRDSLPSGTTTFPLVSLFGLTSSLIGIGGGSLVVPSLIAFGYPILRAIGSAAAIGVFIALPGSIGFAVIHELPLPYSIGYIWLPGLVLTCLTSVLSAPLGSRIASALPAQWLRRTFAIFLILVSTKLLFDALEQISAVT